jgi:hypothetical protein
MMYLTYRPLPNRSRTIFKLTSCEHIPVSASGFFLPFTVHFNNNIFQIYSIGDHD